MVTGRLAACISSVLVIASGAWAQVQVAAPSPGVVEGMRERIERVRATGRVGERRIASTIVLPQLYERRGFLPFWADRARRDALVSAIADSAKDGLDPADYGAPEADGAAETLLDDDIALTDALVRLAYHLHFGKVDPTTFDPHWNLDRTIREEDAVEALLAIVAAPDIATAIDGLRPVQAPYARLRDGLARYRGIAARGGWPTLPPGPTLKPGMKDERVRLLRARLAVEGDLAASAAADETEYDKAVEAAVRNFQRRHGLDDDGAVGPGTRAALDVPVAARIDQLRVNLERARWLLPETAGDLVLVNVAGFHLYFLKNGQVAWDTRVQVGQPYRKTPIFRSTMTYMIFNPEWTVPPGILSKDIIPAMRRDPGALVKKKLQVLDAAGRTVDPSTIDWNSNEPYSYTYRQEKGPAGAMGQFAFMFPNPYAVFLHDTPSKELFDRSGRAFSSGCIRVEKPEELARLVLDDETRWNAAAIKAAQDALVTRTVSLAKPLPVLLMYWTAWVTPDGEAHFRNDLYERDQHVVRGLARPFEVPKPGKRIKRAV